MRKSLTLVLDKWTDDKISRGIERLVDCDRKRKSIFLIYLAQADKRKLYATEGYSSLFRWLTEKHKLSESSALKRIQAARLAAKYRFLYREISEGTYTLSSISRLSPFVNEHNSAKLFAATKGKSVRSVEAYLVTQFPKEEVEDRLRKSVSPLAEDRHHVQFTADSAFIADLETARALLSHRMPQGKLSDVFGLALKTLLRDLQKESKPVRHSGRRVAEARSESEAPEVLTSQKAKPMQPPNHGRAQPFHPAQRSRYIPRGIRRAVTARDQNRCVHVRPDGRACGETWFLELDHVWPFAHGGQQTGENLRMLCWAHNALRAERYFGKQAWLKKKYRAKTEAC